MSAILPELYCGDGSWDAWFGHFQNVAAVNNWDDAIKLRWLKARLTGRAQVTMQRLSKVTPGDFKTLTRAMKERFEPNCQTEICWMKFQARLKQSDETWHDFADDLLLWYKDQPRTRCRQMSSSTPKSMQIAHDTQCARYPRAHTQHPP